MTKYAATFAPRLLAFSFKINRDFYSFPSVRFSLLRNLKNFCDVAKRITNIYPPAPFAPNFATTIIYLFDCNQSFRLNCRPPLLLFLRDTPQGSEKTGVSSPSVSAVFISTFDPTLL